LLVFLMLYFTLCPFETKNWSIFCFGPGFFFNRSSDFCSRMAKEGYC